MLCLSYICNLSAADQLLCKLCCYCSVIAYMLEAVLNTDFIDYLIHTCLLLEYVPVFLVDIL